MATSGKVNRWTFERGSVSIIMMSACLALLSLTCFLASIGQILLQQQAVEAAADLSAIAGAGDLIEGAESACGTARRVATLNNSQMLACTSKAADVVVVVGQEVRSSVMHRIIQFVTATSRAGY